MLLVIILCNLFDFWL